MIYCLSLSKDIFSRALELVLDYFYVKLEFVNDYWLDDQNFRIVGNGRFEIINNSLIRNHLPSNKRIKYNVIFADLSNPQALGICLDLQMKSLLTPIFRTTSTIDYRLITHPMSCNLESILNQVYYPPKVEYVELIANNKQMIEKIIKHGLPKVVNLPMDESKIMISDLITSINSELLIFCINRIADNCIDNMEVIINLNNICGVDK